MPFIVRALCTSNRSKKVSKYVPGLPLEIPDYQFQSQKKILDCQSQPLKNNTKSLSTLTLLLCGVPPPLQGLHVQLVYNDYIYVHVHVMRLIKC